MTAPTPARPDVWASEDARQALQQVRELENVLSLRISDVQKWQRYYDGEQPLLFATPEFRKFFSGQYEGFRDNWCAPVVDTMAEKLTPTGLMIPADSGESDASAYVPDREFAKIWSENECDQQASEAIVEGAIARRSFAMAWGNDADPTLPNITFESPDEVVVGYEPGNRRKRRAALKQWRDENFDFATLYTPDWIWKWQRRRPPSDGPKLWTPDKALYYSWRARELPSDVTWPLPNPAGVVPIVELPNRPRLRSEPLSEVAGVAAMQDAINTLWSYLFSSADFAALPQRVLLGAQLPKIPVLDKDGQPTGAFQPVDLDTWMREAARRRMMAFEGPDAKISQYDAADLEAFTKAIEFAVGHVAAQSRTPAHYFVTGKISNIPESGLLALSQAHISKARERAVFLGAGLRELAAITYAMTDHPDRAQAARRGSFEWQEFEQLSRAQTGDYLQKLREAGFSFAYIASQLIHDPIKLADELARHDAEQAKKAAMLEFGPKP